MTLISLSYESEFSKTERSRISICFSLRNGIYYKLRTFAKNIKYFTHIHQIMECNDDLELSPKKSKYFKYLFEKVGIVRNHLLVNLFNHLLVKHPYLAPKVEELTRFHKGKVSKIYLVTVNGFNITKDCPHNRYLQKYMKTESGENRTILEKNFIPATAPIQALS